MSENKKEDYASIKYIEKDSEPEKKLRTVWTGIYKGVRYEINCFRYDENDTKDKWTHYIIIPIDDQLPKEFADRFWLKPQIDEKGRAYYEYHNSIVSQLNWHCGCTFYSKETQVDQTRRVVKMGCDYQHYWDEGYIYSLTQVYDEVKETINSLLRIVGKVRIRSWGDGVYRYVEDFNQ